MSYSYYNLKNKSARIIPNLSVFNINNINSNKDKCLDNNPSVENQGKKQINKNNTIQLNPYSDEMILVNSPNEEEKKEDNDKEQNEEKEHNKIVSSDIQQLFKDLNVDLFKNISVQTSSEEYNNIPIIKPKEIEIKPQIIIQREDRWGLVYNCNQIINNIHIYQNQFKENYKFRIDNFLNERFAESLYNYIIKMPEHHFNIACGIRNTKYEKKIIPQNYKKNQDNINEANKTFSKGEFSYVFNRGMNNTPGDIMSQLEIIIRNFLNSSEFKEVLSKITGMDITRLNTMFLSKYKAGNFLSPHSDKGNGKIAFVINLSKNWLPHYGGNLHFLSEDRRTIVETWTPAFNNLIVFYVPDDIEENIGLPHFVSHINPGVKLSRYALTGWYS